MANNTGIRIGSTVRLPGIPRDYKVIGRETWDGQDYWRLKSDRGTTTLSPVNQPLWVPCDTLMRVDRKTARP